MESLLVKEIQNELARIPLTYAEAKKQSQFLDQKLGYQSELIEKNIIEKYPTQLKETNRQLWIGLDLQALQTPYSELVQVIEFVKPKKNAQWIDLGAGYGRMGIVLGFLRSDIFFTGYEFLQERVEEGNRVYKIWNLTAEIKQQDIGDEKFQLEYADLYFVYDFGSQKDILILLEKLRIVAQTQPVRVVARGRGIRNWIQMRFPWLCEVVTPQHFDHWSFFQTRD